MAVIAVLPSVGQSTLGWWILTSALAPVRVFPLLGLGAAFALAGFYRSIAAFLLFGVGIVIGFFAQEWLISLLMRVPQAASHEFLSGPISCLAVGLALAPGPRLRFWLLPMAAVIAGAMLTVAIKATDPTVHDPAIPEAGVVIALWIITASSLTLGAFWCEWFAIPSRILGSWLIAIGLLYGAVSLGSKGGLSRPTATTPEPPEPVILPNIGRRQPDLSRPEYPGPQSDDFGKSNQ